MPHHQKGQTTHVLILAILNRKGGRLFEGRLDVRAFCSTCVHTTRCIQVHIYTIHTLFR